MTVDPRVEAAAQARWADRFPGIPWADLDIETHAYFRHSSAVALAAADAVERPVAARLADALRVLYEQAMTVRWVGTAAYSLSEVSLVTFVLARQNADVVLAEWDATREQPT